MWQKFSQFLSRILVPPTTGSGRDRRRPLRFRPALESLEDRRVPTVFFVTTQLDVVNPNDGKLSLREAITRANQHDGADGIVLPAGTFKIALAGANDDANLKGDFDITSPVAIVGAGAALTVIDAQLKDRVFDVIGGSTSINVVFQGLTIRNGFVNGSGGGIQLFNADLVLNQSVVSGNRATGNGGGIFTATNDNKVTLNQSIVSHNVARRSGGGLFGDAAVLNNSIVSRNTAGNDGGGLTMNTANLNHSIVSDNTAIAGDGGGVDVTTSRLTNSTVSGNKAVEGGGITGDTATVINSTVSDNTAGDSGGGFSVGTAILAGSTVSGNTALADGGGIDATTVNLVNSTISGNTAISDQGGGILASALTLLNVTITNNSAHTGGGVFLLTGGTSNVRNTIIAGNVVDATGTGPDVAGTFTSGGHNLIGDGSGSIWNINGTTGDQIGNAANPIDPGLGPLANNGGPTLTHAMLPGSRAIDHGDNSNAPAIDQRGVGRPRDGDGNGSRIVDIGAFEK